MRVTGQWVFERAVALMDEGDENSGRMDTPETRPYKLRTPGILNLLVPECRALLGDEGPYTDIEDLSEVLEVDPWLGRAALPYGLAAHLIRDEDPAGANFFQQRYEALLARRLKGKPGEWEEIPLPYGGPGGGETGGRTVWR